MVLQVIVGKTFEAINKKIKEKRLDKQLERGEITKKEHETINKYLKDQ